MGCKNRSSCHALVVMLYVVGEYSHKRICEVTGYKSACVGNIISRRIGPRNERGHIVREKWSKPLKPLKLPNGIAEVESEYLAGATTYELGKKYGVNHATISKWMIKLGHNRGRNWFEDETRTCAICGKTFTPKSHNAKTCSRKCHNALAGAFLSGYKRRADKYGAEYDPAITLDAVFYRDGGVCQICGEACDYESKSANGKGVGPLYPTIDHITPLKNGGSHTWDNLQLAHHFCNSMKREHELTDEFKKVIAHAKEQAASYKCA